jgi:regulator of protease activity HflC (stomatin/prohibitin superfamily)
MELDITLAILAFLIVVVLVILYLSVRIVQPDEQMVVFRLGRTNESLVRGPGLRFLIPVIDRPVRIARGTEGIVQAPLNPTGTARLAGVTLPARATDDRAVDRDTPVRLVGFDGLTALVEPMQPEVRRG